MMTRRGLLWTGMQLTAAGALIAAGSGLAASLKYTEHSPDPAKPCSGCGFFTAGSGGCGSCSIFNSNVNANGHCDSWAPKG